MLSDAPPSSGPQVLGTVILGGGPGGVALLLAALRRGAFDALVGDGLAIVERGREIGRGAIGDYVITSDSGAETFVDCLQNATEPALVALRRHPAAEEVARHAPGAVPLRLVGRLMQVIGDRLAAILAGRGALLLTEHAVLQVVRAPDGLWQVVTRGIAGGGPRVLLARNVVFSLGGEQPIERLHTECVAGQPLLPRYAETLVQSGSLFRAPGRDAVNRRLRGLSRPRAVVVGGSTSAVAAANLLLTQLPDVAFGPGGVTILHRRPMRVFYASAEAALAEDYAEFGPDDICPLTGRVFRLAGLRLDSRELLMRARGLGGRAPEPRLRLQMTGAQPDAATIDMLDGADLIVAALGYRPRLVPCLDIDGAPLALRGNTDAMVPLVDDACRIVDGAGEPWPGLFALGLANGFVPSGAFGGEASFVGQANGLWLWQTDVGGMVVDQICARRSGPPGRMRHAETEAV